MAMSPAPMPVVGCTIPHCLGIGGIGTADLHVIVGEGYMGVGTEMVNQANHEILISSQLASQLQRHGH